MNYNLSKECKKMLQMQNINLRKANCNEIDKILTVFLKECNGLEKMK